MSITVVVPVSPIKSHPSTDILNETIQSVRYWLPDAEIFLTFDGVRDEQETRRYAYEHHIKNVLELAVKDRWPVVPFIFDHHVHQTGMLRRIIDHIPTPLMLYVEQDTPLVDEPIDWDAIAQPIRDGISNVVRLYHEAEIPKVHRHLMHGEEPNTPLIRTSQWSQRPHLASVPYYRTILKAHFTPHAKCFIEDRMYGVLDEAYHLDGLAGWHQHRVHVYNPKAGLNMKRSTHTDGRAGEAKYDTDQVF
ncbi:MAG: hypothetical protein K0U84_18290 [Actinomycetia bacterium]|nr:hypothetical protein [Actinomycetes bacterium]